MILLDFSIILFKSCKIWVKIRKYYHILIEYINKVYSIKKLGWKIS